MSTTSMRRAVLVGVVVAATWALPGAAVAQDPLPGDPTTGSSEEPAVGAGQAAVVDVSVEVADGFDRVTFETEGDGQPGWFVLYEDDPRSDGSGEPIAVDGDAALRVVVSGVPLPDDTSATTFLDDVEGPDGSIVREVVNDTIFEGQHTFVVGLDEQVPYRIGRLRDPDRIVIDLVVDEMPVGGVDTGLGGTAATSSPAGPLGMVAVALIVVALVLAWRGRRPTIG